MTYEITTPLSDSLLQAETDRLYKGFVEQLTAAGYEVVPRDTIMASRGTA